ncbi:MAG: transketolase family protein [Deltaproteobacteria bacterium]|nr:transketolase family protein [Deltaproteobacteria bacterium]
MDKEMRVVYAETLMELAEKNADVVLLEADLMKANSTKIFKNRFPERTFDVGVAEANMVGIAAGLSATGKIPFAGSFGCFSARRAYDQFFIAANYARLNVKLVGSFPGIAGALNGGTHMPFEDLGLMRNIPGLVIMEPCDGPSLKSFIKIAASYKGSCYIRLHPRAVPAIYDEKEFFEIGKGKLLQDGNDVTIIATGAILVPEALKACEMLAKEGISAAVIDMPTIKPIDEGLIVDYAKKTKAVVTCENHQIVNGLGSAVAEVLSEHYPTLLRRIGVNEEFGEVGTLEYLQQRYRLTADEIAIRAKEINNLKREYH